MNKIGTDPDPIDTIWNTLEFGLDAGFTRKAIAENIVSALHLVLPKCEHGKTYAHTQIIKDDYPDGHRDTVWCSGPEHIPGHCCNSVCLICGGGGPYPEPIWYSFCDVHKTRHRCEHTHVIGASEPPVALKALVESMEPPPATEHLSYRAGYDAMKQRVLVALRSQPQALTREHRVRVPSKVYDFALKCLDADRAMIGDLTDPEVQGRYARSIKRLRDFLAEATEIPDFALYADAAPTQCEHPGLRVIPAAGGAHCRICGKNWRPGETPFDDPGPVAAPQVRSEDLPRDQMAKAFASKFYPGLTWNEISLNGTGRIYEGIDAIRALLLALS